MKMTALFGFILLSLSIPAYAAGSYQLGSGCFIKKFENGKWQASDATVLDSANFTPLDPKQGQVRFKINNQWYYTGENCLVSTGTSSNEVKAHSIYVGGVVGGFYGLTGTGNKLQMGFGGRAGYNLMPLYKGIFSIGAHFSTTSRTTTVGTATNVASYTEVTFNPLLRNIGKLGFYMGPEIGIGTRKLTRTVGTVSALASGTVLDIGANIGFEYHLSEHLTIGPDLHLTHLGTSPVGYAAETLSKFMLALTAQF
jgi:hypothetical protein